MNGARPINGDALKMLARAYFTAARAHAGQTRKGPEGDPYMNHLCEVAAMVAENGGDPETVAAAVLHDTVEDTPIRRADIEADFGGRVAALVMAVTDAPEWDELPLSERKALQADEMRDASDEAKAVKIADQTSNLLSLPTAGQGWTPERNRAYLDGALKVVEACRGPHPVLEARFDAAAEKIGRWLETGRLE